jgi:hypothetical protein
MDFFFSRLEGVASCWFIFSRIKKDESQGENCHATTMLSQEKPIAIIFFFSFFSFPKQLGEVTERVVRRLEEGLCASKADALLSRALAELAIVFIF